MISKVLFTCISARILIIIFCSVIIYYIGEPNIRPHSELKASTPVGKPPLPPMSAPPQLPQPTKLESK